MAWQPLPGSHDPAPRQVGDNLDRVVKSLGMPSTRSVSGIFGDWDSVVGPELAAHCRPTGLRQGTLTITAEDPAWATELQWMESTLLDRCRDAFGEGAVTAVNVVSER